MCIISQGFLLFWINWYKSENLHEWQCYVWVFSGISIGRRSHHLLWGPMGERARKTSLNWEGNWDQRVWAVQSYEATSTVLWSVSQFSFSLWYWKFESYEIVLFFSEHVTLYKKPKPDYKDLIPSYVPYKQSYMGNVLFNGKLIKANANYGCFMTMQSSTASAQKIPENLRVCTKYIKKVCYFVSRYRLSPIGILEKYFLVPNPIFRPPFCFCFFSQLKPIQHFCIYHAVQNKFIIYSSFIYLLFIYLLLFTSCACDLVLWWFLTSGSWQRSSSSATVSKITRALPPRWLSSLILLRDRCERLFLHSVMLSDM